MKVESAENETQFVENAILQFSSIKIEKSIEQPRPQPIIRWLNA